jgi:lysophospholipase L1-like esterase
MGILDAPVTTTSLGAVAESATKGAYASTAARLTALASDAPFATLPAYNSTLTNRTKWRQALGRVNAGTGNAKLLCIGDSTMWGLNADGPDGSAPPRVLAGMLDRLLAPTQYTFGIPYGDQGSTVAPGNDARWSYGSGWGHSTWGFGGKGCVTHSGTATSTPLTYTPGIECDTFEVYYMANSGLGSIDLSIDGGAVTTVSTGGGTIRWAKTTLTVAAGSSHVLSIVKSLNTVFILGVNAYLSTKKSVHVWNAGLCSSKAYASGAVGWGDTGVGKSVDGIKFIDPDLTIIQLGINDAQLTPYSTTAEWETAIRAIIAAAKETGDVILSSVVPSDPALNTGATVAREQGYRDRALTIAQETGCTYFDVFGRFGSWTTAQAQGFISDALHLTAAGGADVADAYRKLITA